MALSFSINAISTRLFILIMKYIAAHAISRLALHMSNSQHCISSKQMALPRQLSPCYCLPMCHCSLAIRPISAKCQCISIFHGFAEILDAILIHVVSYAQMETKRFGFHNDRINLCAVFMSSVMKAIAAGLNIFIIL